MRAFFARSAQLGRYDYPRRGSWLSALAVVVAGIGAAATGYEAGQGTLLVPALVLLLCLTFGVVAMPIGSLPVATVLVLLLIPIDSAPSPTLEHVPLAVLPLAVWMIHARKCPNRPLVACSGGLLVWVVLSLLFAPVSTRAGGLWAVAFIATPCLIGLSGARLGDQRALDVLLWVSAGLGAYALVETFVLHSNPLMNGLYQSATTPLRQIWSSYRATTVLGHPLVNATVFAVTAVLAFDRYVRGAARYAGIQTLLLLGGELATKSRGPMVALGVGLLAVLVLRSRDGVPRRRFAAAGVLVACAAVAGAAIYLERSQSQEGAQSALNRSGVLANTKQAIAGHTLLGVGPGESEAYRIAARLRGVAVNLYPTHAEPPPTDLENAYAEMAVSIGIPGLGLFVAVLLTAAAGALSERESRGVGVAIIVFAISIFGFNALEGHPKLLVLLGLLIAAGGRIEGARDRLERTPIAVAE